MSDPVLVANVVGLQTALDAKQVTLVSGTNIKTVNSTSLLGSGDIAISSGSLTTVTITDAAVAMTANRRYQGSIASFTADRNYTLPAGTAGDVIEVQITTGDDLYELILLGATGVSINGGSAATEWSRLFISNELVRFYCFATNDWRVVVDGRIAQSVNGYLASDLANSYASAAYSRIPFDTLRQDNGSIANTTINNWTVTPRRTGTYAIHLRASNGGVTTLNGLRVNINGVATVLNLGDGSGGSVLTGSGLFQVSANHAIYGELYRENGTSTAEGVQSGDERNSIFLRELL
jgi:hypothetical protein